MSSCKHSTVSFHPWCRYTHTHIHTHAHAHAHIHTLTNTHATFLHNTSTAQKQPMRHSAHSSLTAPRKFPGGDSTSILCLWQKQQKLHIVQQLHPHLKGRTMWTTSLFWSSLKTIVKLRIRPWRRRPRVLESEHQGWDITLHKQSSVSLSFQHRYREINKPSSAHQNGLSAVLFTIVNFFR